MPKNYVIVKFIYANTLEIKPNADAQTFVKRYAMAKLNGKYFNDKIQATNDIIAKSDKTTRHTRHHKHPYINYHYGHGPMFTICERVQFTLCVRRQNVYKAFGIQLNQMKFGN